MELRTEQPEDFAAVEALIAEAFRTLPESDHTEHLLVAKLRRSPSFVPALSITATAPSAEGRSVIVGHILLTKLQLGARTLLALAPLAVAPDKQRRGIGAALVKEAVARARRLGYPGIVVFGHPGYYPRFGFRPAADFGIAVPFDAPSECVMALECEPGSLAGISGVVRYDAAFGL